MSDTITTSVSLSLYHRIRVRDATGSQDSVAEGGGRAGLLLRAIAIDMGATVSIARRIPVYQDNWITTRPITIASRGHGTNRHIGKRFQSVKDDMEAGLISVPRCGRCECTGWCPHSSSVRRRGQ